MIHQDMLSWKHITITLFKELVRAPLTINTIAKISEPGQSTIRVAVLEPIQYVVVLNQSGPMDNDNNTLDSR